MDEFRKIIAKNITYLRTAAGLTQQALAEKLNYSDKSVSKWERGDGLPDVAVLAQMARIFDVSVDWIITDHPKPRPPRSKNGMTRNHRLITEIALWGVLYTALVIFFGFWLTGQIVWQVFIGMLPVSCIVYLVLNSVWGNPRHNLYVISALIWTTLLFVYLLALEDNLWLLFLIGIPAQAATVLAFHIRLPQWKK